MVNEKSRGNDLFYTANFKKDGVAIRYVIDREHKKMGSDYNRALGSYGKMEGVQNWTDLFYVRW